MRDRETDYVNRIEELEVRNKELQEAIYKMKLKEESYKNVERDYESMKERLREFEKTNASLQIQSELQTETVKRSNDQREEYEKQYDNLRRQIDLLNQDKTFMTRENATLHDRIKRLENNIERGEDQRQKQYAELLDAKKSAQSYLERLLNNAGDYGSAAQKKHTEELNQLKLIHEKDLQMHKDNLCEVYEKKIEYLREAKEESEMRLAKTERDLSEKTASYDEILVEYRKIERMVDEEIGDVKLELRLKRDEAQRITHLYEENLSLVKELKLENAVLKEKLDLVKNDYYRLEAMERQKNADALAQVAVYKERLAHYEAIEKELDDAIISVAENEEQNEVGNIVLNAVKAAPTAANRRVQQSLLLANRLQAKHKECEKLKQELKDIKNQMKNMVDEGKMYRKLADKANQPYSYLMADIEKGEKDLNMAFKRLSTKDEEIAALKEENKALKIAVNNLQDDLRKLMNKRKELDSLQTTLMDIIKGSSTKKISVDLLKSKLSESKRSFKGLNDGSDPLGAMKLMGQKKTGQLANKSKDNASKSRSPQRLKSKDLDDNDEEFKQTLKRANAEVPAWYNALKSNLKS